VHAAETVLYALVEAHFEAGGHGRRSWLRRRQRPRTAPTQRDERWDEGARRAV